MEQYFEWDEAKNRKNQKKHDISFETASLVFEDPLRISIQDRYTNGEERWQTIGRVKGVLMLLVAHTILMKMTVKSSESLVQGKSLKRSETNMSMVRYSHKELNEKFGEKQDAEIQRLLAKGTVPDDQLDLSDIPEITDWSNAVRQKSILPPSKATNFNSVRC
ncbi:hypothetical protein AB988_4359 [Acinetobacter baumannii]|nr:hypothetical protein AB988_4359 [Acinetobacter baumannii]